MTTPSEPEPTVSVEAMELMAGLMERSMAESQGIINQHIELLTAQLNEAHAVIYLIREKIIELHSGNYMPTPRAVMDALAPFPPDVKDLVAEYTFEDGRARIPHWPGME